ncbi:UPF0158 family protein [Lacticaseibacillus mingshuiensis]|uniref:UPF0158 family protein n=1 Tax=Lacticaseibacillus mingshuiensis TaxID=2799574 RepID=A0ABW4CHU0_9LACO|nr:UPF0158 family protein [Lacticaseibacillus mingshuiensis]
MVQVAIQDIVDAIGMTGTEDQYYLDLGTGDLLFYSDMAADEDDVQERLDAGDDQLLPLPDLYEINDYATMAAFVDTQDDPVNGELARAIQGRGAFRRFKDEIIRLGVAQAWYAFEAAAHYELAVAWCNENHVAYTEKA